MENDPTHENEKRVTSLSEAGREKLTRLEEQLQEASASVKERQAMFQEIFDSMMELGRLVEEELGMPEEIRDAELLNRIGKAFPEFQELLEEQARITDDFAAKEEELRSMVEKLKPHIERIEGHSQDDGKEGE